MTYQTSILSSYRTLTCVLEMKDSKDSFYRKISAGFRADTYLLHGKLIREIIIFVET